MQHGVRVRVLGDLHMLPRDVMVAVARAVNYTKENTRWGAGELVNTGQVSVAAQPLHNPHILQCFLSWQQNRGGGDKGCGLPPHPTTKPNHVYLLCLHNILGDSTVTVVAE